MTILQTWVREGPLIVERPSISGNFWCIFTQVFPHYRLFFLVVFQVHAFIYVYPLWRILRFVLLSIDSLLGEISLSSCIRCQPTRFLVVSIFRDYPVTLWFVYLQVVAITSSYPTYADFCVYLPLFFSFSMYHKCKLSEVVNGSNIFQTTASPI